MNSPYMGKFKITQKFKGAAHDGLDLVGVDSKEIHSTVDGKVVFAGWENPKNHKQGFGQYVKIMKDGTEQGYYFGHMSEIRVKVGDTVKCTQVIGIEGSTGKSTGSHCHYCVRVNGAYQDINKISGIPNTEGAVCDDGYRGESSKPQAGKSYVVGIVYKTNTALNVREGAGKNYKIKRRDQLTADGKRHSRAGTYAVLKAGTSVRCLNMVDDGVYRWMQIPSGWVCAVENGNVYID